MSMITGCPACGTQFRVVPDQLKISEGWVRCGHCSEVFDATAHLQDEAALAGLAVPQGTPQESVSPTEATAVEAPVAPEAAADVAVEPAPFDPYVPSSTPADPARTQVEEQGYLPSMAFLRSDAEASVLPTGGLDPTDFAEDEDDAPLEDVSFVREARRKAFWRRPATRAVLVLVVLVLAALLALQAAVHERDRIAATDPRMRPSLEALCAPLGCRVGPPRRIDAIAIDSSGFTKVRADSYRLTFSLKNQAGQAVAIPALELTLTDTQDQAVVRRVLTPRELGATTETIAPAAEWSGAASLVLDVPANGSRIAGYRLLAFYP